MGYQLAAAVTCAAWSFVVTCILLFVIDRIPGCHIRESEEDEIRGLDFKYLHDVDEEMESRLFGISSPGGMGHVTDVPAGVAGGVGGRGILSPAAASSPPSSVQGSGEREKENVQPPKRD